MLIDIKKMFKSCSSLKVCTYSTLQPGAIKFGDFYNIYIYPDTPNNAFNATGGVYEGSIAYGDWYYYYE